MSFDVFRIRNVFEPDIQGLGKPELIRVHSTLDEAAANVDVLDSGLYVLLHNEAGRPEYVIVEGGFATLESRWEDMGYYDWGRYDDSTCSASMVYDVESGTRKLVEPEHRNACGCCDSCLRFMNNEDVDFLKTNNLLTNKNSIL